MKHLSNYIYTFLCLQVDKPLDFSASATVKLACVVYNVQPQF